LSLAIGLGGNLGGDAAIRARFERAREALARWSGHAARSSALYRTAPIGPVQPDYWNAAVALVVDATTLPRELIATVLEIEALCGRDRRGEAHWGPRAIDLDVLAWDARVIDTTRRPSAALRGPAKPDLAIATPELVVPHPRLAERRFVIEPLIDLYGADHAIAGTTLGALAARVASQRVERVADTW